MLEIDRKEVLRLTESLRRFTSRRTSTTGSTRLTFSGSGSGSLGIALSRLFGRFSVDSSSGGSSLGTLGLAGTRFASTRSGGFTIFEFDVGELISGIRDCV